MSVVSLSGVLRPKPLKGSIDVLKTMEYPPDDPRQQRLVNIPRIKSITRSGQDLCIIRVDTQQGPGALVPQNDLRRGYNGKTDTLGSIFNIRRDVAARIACQMPLPGEEKLSGFMAQAFRDDVGDGAIIGRSSKPYALGHWLIVDGLASEFDTLAEARRVQQSTGSMDPDFVERQIRPTKLTPSDQSNTLKPEKFVDLLSRCEPGYVIAQNSWDGSSVQARRHFHLFENLPLPVFDAPVLNSVVLDDGARIETLKYPLPVIAISTSSIHVMTEHLQKIASETEKMATDLIVTLVGTYDVQGMHAYAIIHRRTDFRACDYREMNAWRTIRERLDGSWENLLGGRSERPWAGWLELSGGVLAQSGHAAERMTPEIHRQILKTLAPDTAIVGKLLHRCGLTEMHHTF